VNCGPRSYFLYIAITYLLYSHCLLYSHTIITFHSIRSYPLFQANRWDWQPHRKLGGKYLVVLCVGSALQLAKQSLDEAPYKLSWAVVHPLLSWTINLSFLTEGKSCCYIHHTFLLEFPMGWSFTRHQPQTQNVYQNSQKVLQMLHVSQFVTGSQRVLIMWHR
jgi:hypothetical protein